MKTTITIAKHIINESYEKGIHDISPNKLQKIMYLTYQEVAKQHKEYLLQEKFIVSREGFVLGSIKELYKDVGDHEYLDIPGKYGLGDLDQKTMDIINQVLDRYGHIPVYDLVEYIHGSYLWKYCMSNGIRTIDYLDIMDRG